MKKYLRFTGLIKNRDFDYIDEGDLDEYTNFHTDGETAITVGGNAQLCDRGYPISCLMSWESIWGRLIIDSRDEVTEINTMPPETDITTGVPGESWDPSDFAVGFEVYPSDIVSSGSTTLKWWSTNVASVTINDETVGITGEREDALTKSTDYVLRYVSNGGTPGEIRRHVTVYDAGAWPPSEPDDIDIPVPPVAGDKPELSYWLTLDTDPINLWTNAGTTVGAVSLDETTETDSIVDWQPTNVLAETRDTWVKERVIHDEVDAEPIGFSPYGARGSVAVSAKSVDPGEMAIDAVCGHFSSSVSAEGYGVAHFGEGYKITDTNSFTTWRRLAPGLDSPYLFNKLLPVNTYLDMCIDINMNLQFTDVPMFAGEDGGVLASVGMGAAFRPILSSGYSSFMTDHPIGVSWETILSPRIGLEANLGWAYSDYGELTLDKQVYKCARVFPLDYIARDQYAAAWSHVDWTTVLAMYRRYLVGWLMGETLYSASISFPFYVSTGGGTGTATIRKSFKMGVSSYDNSVINR